MPKILRADGMNKCLGCFTCMLTCAAVNKKEHSMFKSAIRVRTTGGLTSSFVGIVCLGCTDERACGGLPDRCPKGAYRRRCDPFPGKVYRLQEVHRRVYRWRGQL